MTIVIQMKSIDITIKWKEWLDKRNCRVIKEMIKSGFECLAGIEYDNDNKVALVLENIAGFAKHHNRSVEKQTCIIIAHETMHYVLDMEQGLNASRQFDNIANTVDLK